MDIVIASALQNLCVSSSTKSSDFVLRLAENKKFMSDSKSSFSIQKSSTHSLGHEPFGFKGSTLLCHSEGVRDAVGDPS